MLHLLDASLETFLRLTVPLPEREIDISFDAPDRDWGARVTRPTVDVYLWDVRRNLTERDTGLELIEGEDGRRFRRAPLPRVECRYLVTAWASEVRDEHSLLGDVLSALLLNPIIGAEHLSGSYAAVRPLPTLEVAMRDGRAAPTSGLRWAGSSSRAWTLW